MILVHAQTTTKNISVGVILPDGPNVDWNSASDVEVMIQAVATTEPTAANLIPQDGIFVSASEPMGPPLPGSMGWPAWNLGDDDTGLTIWLLDDLEQPQMQMRAMAMAMDVPLPEDSSGDDGTNDYTPDYSTQTVNYGTNLWIANFALSSGNAVGIVSNTAADISYEIQTRQSLTSTDDWTSAGFVLGSELTNWTALAMANVSLANNAFFRIRSWASSDGSGLPDWWELEFFGTTGIDPYGDPMGDGWSNLQKFQNGMNPNQFYTPPAPQGLTVSYNANNGTATINWQPSPGPVTGYIVETPNGNFTVSATTHSFVDTNLPTADPNYYWDTGPTIFGDYSVQAIYGTNYSDWSGSVPLEPDLSGFYPATVNLIPGPQGSAYLAASVLPPGTVALRLSHYDIVAENEFGDFSHDGSNDIPVTASSGGLYLIPSSLLRMTNTYGYSLYEWFVQTVNTNGGLSAAHSFFAPTMYEDEYYSYIFSLEDRSHSWLVPPYFDGRQQLKQNLIFLLRAATMDFPFDFSDSYSSGGWNFTNSVGYAYSGFYEWNYFGFDVLWPFQANAYYRNFVFSSSDISNGRLNTGAAGNYDYSGLPLSLNEPAKYQFQVPATSGSMISALLATNNTRWLGSYPFDSALFFGMYSSGYLGEIGITNYYDQNLGNAIYSMANNAQNLFGLTNLSANISGATILSAGGSLMEGLNFFGYFYPETTQPQFQTVEYDFWNTSWGNWGSVPGSSGFVTANHGDLLITSVGDAVFEVAGYAKLVVLNG